MSFGHRFLNAIPCNKPPDVDDVFLLTVAPRTADSLEFVRDGLLWRGCQHGVQEDHVVRRRQVGARSRLCQREEEDEGVGGGVVLPVPDHRRPLGHGARQLHGRDAELHEC